MMATAASPVRRNSAANAQRILRSYGAVAALILTGFGLLLTWNVVHYPAGNGIDSALHFKYVETLREHHRLPTRTDLPDGWHNPPAFHIAAAVTESAWKLVDHSGSATKRARKVVQLFNVLLALGIAVLVLLTARELFPRSRTAQVGALGLVVLAPPFTRTAVMYHGQTLATFLSTAALFVVVRALARGQPSLQAGALAGALLGVGVLTRVFVLASVAAMCVVLGAYFVFTPRRETLRMAGALIAAVVVLSAPWFIHQQVRYGSPTALPAAYAPPDKPLFDRQPPEFYVGGPFRPVFTRPYRPSYTNRMPQTVYSDWWGDYFLYFDIPSDLRMRQVARGGRLPDGYNDARATQSYVGILPTILVLVGVVGLLVTGVRRRSAALLTIPVMVAVTALEALDFFIGYPMPDGDNMKATYILTIAPPLAIVGGWALWRLRKWSALAFTLLLVPLLMASLFDLQFLWIDHL